MRRNRADYTEKLFFSVYGNLCTCKYSFIHTAYTVNKKKTFFINASYNKAY